MPTKRNSSNSSNAGNNNNNNYSRSKKDNLLTKIIDNNYEPTENEIKKLTGLTILELDKKFYIEKIKEYHNIETAPLNRIEGLQYVEIDNDIFYKKSKINTRKTNQGKTTKNYTGAQLKTGKSITNIYKINPNIGQTNFYSQTIPVASGGGSIIDFEKYPEITPKTFKYILQSNIQKFIDVNGLNFDNILKDIFVFNNQTNPALFQKYNNMIPQFIIFMKNIIDKQYKACSEDDKAMDIHEFITKYLFGYYDPRDSSLSSRQYNLSRDEDKYDIYSAYYKYPNALHIHKLNFDTYKALGIELPDIIVSQDVPPGNYNPEDAYNKYLIIINFVRLKYNVTQWINLNPANQLENDILDLDIGKKFHTQYVHNEIDDYHSFTIRNAIYFLKQFTESNEPLLIHCGAGTGRTHIQTLLLVICRILTKALMMYKNEKKGKKNNNAKLIEIKTYIITFIKDIFDDQKLKETISIPCNITTNNEIYDHGQLYIFRYNTMLLAILYYITKKNLYEPWLGDIDIKFISIDKSKTVGLKLKYNLDTIKTSFLDKLNTIDNVKKYFDVPHIESVTAINTKPLINLITEKLPDNIDDI